MVLSQNYQMNVINHLSKTHPTMKSGCEPSREKLKYLYIENRIGKLCITFLKKATDKRYVLHY